MEFFRKIPRELNVDKAIAPAREEIVAIKNLRLEEIFCILFNILTLNIVCIRN